jgi:tRNA (adenine57-N1/adenine58-N1)-methyltransferase
VTARRLAEGITAPVRRRRPSKGAYAADYVADGSAGVGADAVDPGEVGEVEYNEDGTVNSSVQSAGARLPKVRRSLP